MHCTVERMTISLVLEAISIDDHNTYNKKISNDFSNRKISAGQESNFRIFRSVNKDTEQYSRPSILDIYEGHLEI